MGGWRSRLLGRFFSSIIMLLIIVIVNFIPTFNLKTNNMNVKEGNWVNVFYDKEKDAAQDVFELADIEVQIQVRYIVTIVLSMLLCMK